MVRFLTRKIVLILVFINLILSLAFVVTADQTVVLDEDLKTTITIMNFSDQTTADELYLGKRIVDAMSFIAGRTDYYKVIQSKKTDSVVTDEISAAKVGRELSAEKVIIGKISNYYVIDSPREVIIEGTAQVIDSASGRVVGYASIKESSRQKFDYMGSNQPFINEAIDNLSSELLLALKKDLYVEGIVISIVAPDVLRIDLDKSRRINIGDELAVVRAGEKIAKLKVEDVRMGYSVARITSLQPNQKIQVNDKVKLLFNQVQSDDLTKYNK